MANNVVVKGGDLSSIFKDIEVKSEYEIIEATKVASKKAADEGVKRLKVTSPKSKGHSKYAKSWKVKKIDDGYVIYSDMPGLTHLLENGHDVIRNGIKVGRARAIPHIKPVEEETKNIFVDEVIKEVNRRLSQ